MKQIEFAKKSIWLNKKAIGHSLVEIMLSLIIISCFAAILAPVISMRLAPKTVTVGGGKAANILRNEQCSQLFGEN